MNGHGIERRVTCGWNVALAVLTVAVVVAAYAFIRDRRRTERARIHAVCPSGTAQRVIDKVNAQPLPRLCNRVADVVFGKVN